MNKLRLQRIDEELKKLISGLISTEIKDPRIKDITSVNNVNISNDLSIAKVYISVLGSEDDMKSTIEGLESAKGFIRKRISDEIDLRITPDLRFIPDQSIEYSMHMQKLIEKVKEDDLKRNKGN